MFLILNIVFLYGSPYSIKEMWGSSSPLKIKENSLRVEITDFSTYLEMYLVVVRSVTVFTRIRLLLCYIITVFLSFNGFLILSTLDVQ